MAMTVSMVTRSLGELYGTLILHDSVTTMMNFVALETFKFMNGGSIDCRKCDSLFSLNFLFSAAINLKNLIRLHHFPSAVA